MQSEVLGMVQGRFPKALIDIHNHVSVTLLEAAQEWSLGFRPVIWVGILAPSTHCYRTLGQVLDLFVPQFLI